VNLVYRKIICMPNTGNCGNYLCMSSIMNIVETQFLRLYLINLMKPEPVLYYKLRTQNYLLLLLLLLLLQIYSCLFVIRRKSSDKSTFTPALHE
jgi:hypothetical protein